MYKKKTTFGLLGITLLVGLTACSSGVQQPDLELGDEIPELSTQGTSTSHVVPSSASDAEEVNGSTYTTSPVLELGYKTDGTPQTTGIRFLGVAIPKGARITSAYLQFTAVTDKSEATNLTIVGQDAASGGSFSAAANNITSRTKTSARSSWQPGAWVDGQRYNSSSIVGIVQEIVNRSDWQKGAAMVFVISGTGTRKAQSYDASSTLAPKLIVGYDLPPIADLNPNCYTTGTYAATISEPLRTVTTTFKYRGLTKSTRIDASKLTVQLNNHVGTGGEKALLIQNNTDASRVCLRGGIYNPNVPKGASWEPDFHTDGGIYMDDSPNTTIENVAIYRGADAFTLKEGNHNTTIRDSYVYRAGDDAIENDRKSANMVVDDILVDSAYTGFSCQHEVAFNGTRVEWTIKNSLIALRRESGAVDAQKSIKLWKFNKANYDKYGRTNCRVTFQDNVILITRSTGDLVIDPATYKLIKSPGNPEYVSDSPMRYEACSGHQNTIVYTGPTSGNYYKQLQAEVARHPECFKLTTDYNVWKNARTAWFDRHPNFTAKYGDETGKFINYESN